MRGWQLVSNLPLVGRGGRMPDVGICPDNRCKLLEMTALVNVECGVKTKGKQKKKTAFFLFWKG